MIGLHDEPAVTPLTGAAAADRSVRGQNRCANSVDKGSARIPKAHATAVRFRAIGRPPKP